MQREEAKEGRTAFSSGRDVVLCTTLPCRVHRLSGCSLVALGRDGHPAVTDRLVLL